MFTHLNRGTFDVTAGSLVEIELPVNNRGNLRRFVLVQRTGVLAGFTGELYEAPLATRSLTSAQVYKVIPVSVAAAAAAAAFELFDTNGAGYPYQVTSSDVVTTFRDHKLFLSINVAGAGTKTFDWVLAVESPV